MLDDHFDIHMFPVVDLSEKDLLGVVNWSEIEGKTLEVGCGTGRFVKQFVKHSLDITGVDRAKSLVKYTSQFAPVIFADGHKLPFKDKEFDNVFSHGVIHCSEDWYNIVYEMKRVWNKKGFLVIGLCIKGSWFYYFRMLKPPMIYFNKSNFGRWMNDWFHSPYYFITETKFLSYFDELSLIKKSKTSLGALNVYRFRGNLNE